ncbi:MAG TPA: Arm DNA-binding domain-containing protein [Mucilaginibacter sp.]|jgi:hypothetical protein|nr:Arm DNA-binding domain-containing protein [Mucilaginibacter sp.]
MKNTYTFSVLIWANKTKGDANGSVPLYARVTVNNRRAEISLKKKIDSALWDVNRGIVKGNTKEAKTVKLSL